MSLVRVHNFSVSLDGFGTVAGQQLNAPFGHAGPRLLEWALEPRPCRDLGIPGESEGSFGPHHPFAGTRGPGPGVETPRRNPARAPGGIRPRGHRVGPSQVVSPGCSPPRIRISRTG